MPGSPFNPTEGCVARIGAIRRGVVFLAITLQSQEQKGDERIRGQTTGLLRLSGIYICTMTMLIKFNNSTQTRGLCLEPWKMTLPVCLGYDKQLLIVLNK